MEILKLYIDTQLISYFREDRTENAVKAKDIINRNRSKFELYYSSAHMADYLRDKTDYKKADLIYMGNFGIEYFIWYDYFERAVYNNPVLPIDAFYNNRKTSEQYKYEYKNIRKPRLDNLLLGLYDWYKATLKSHEENTIDLEKIDKNDLDSFLALKDIVNIKSDELTKDKFIKMVDDHWDDYVFKLPDKEASKYALSINALDGKIVSYKNEKFDLSKPNLYFQVKDSKFRKDYLEFIQSTMFALGLNLTNKYDPLVYVTSAYSYLQMFGIERDKNQKFNIYSSVNDAGHCFFASFCDILLTEDKGLYNRSKIAYGVISRKTQVYNLEDFIKHFK